MREGGKGREIEGREGGREGGRGMEGRLLSYLSTVEAPLAVDSISLTNVDTVGQVLIVRI